ncbi:sucrose-phosphate synthase [Acidithiobacillus marinus]|uniref:sucrose-phosphate synthase n=1 Tax=Acidithiobacillus marinus TaxID=187490 RepID=A0A2I1DLW7_9PROT|nr:HAD family hydrolase [Acidithiobacillus marinus]PKY10862.1 sucrose-phosphate synthase [Acidithiobacillus marinus]
MTEARKPASSHQDQPVQDGQRLYLVLISMHGLIRAQNMELGRDADTGGQVLYVVELLRALATHPGVARVELLTRQIRDSRIDSDYAQAQETLSDAPNARIIRLPAGPDEYLPKEALWPHLDSFSDHAMAYLRQQDRLPDLIHSHYADAGYVGMRLALQLGVPLVHTGHSLGRSKRQSLLASGESERRLEEKYHLSHRIRVEEETLSMASLVVVSTQDEITSQYGMYDWAAPERMRVIPPGVNLSRFDPAPRPAPPIVQELNRFLRHPDRPPILALSRPDERKNIAGLIHAYGQNPALQARANLVIVAGNRDDIRDMPAGSRHVLTEILLLIDRYNLYGQVAYPRHHQPDDVPDLYRWAASLRGVFINPALTEPFGLTLIEAAACGLPILATEDGGPRDIIANCHNGHLIDPLDIPDMGKQLLNILNDAKKWQQYAQNGIAGVRQNYTWQAHVEKYLAALDALPLTAPLAADIAVSAEQRVSANHLLFLGARLLDPPPAPNQLEDLVTTLHQKRRQVALGLVTTRPLHELLALLKQRRLAIPEILITRAGTQIHYGTGLTRDRAWSRHISVNWQGDRVYDLLSETPGLHLASRSSQGFYAVHGFIDGDFAGLVALEDQLHQQDIPARLVAIHPQEFLVIPQRASLGFAIRYVADQLDMALDHVLVVGSAQADLDLLGGNILAAQIGREIAQDQLREDIYPCTADGLTGVMEAIAHYHFLENSTQGG